MEKVIVIGDDHINTLGLVRSLGIKGLYVIAVIMNSKKSFVEKSKYTKEIFYFDFSKNSPSEEKNLIALISEQKEKCVVIPASDQAAALLDDLYEKLTPFCYLPSISCGKTRLREFLNKENVNVIAKQIGIDTPEGISVIWDGFESSVEKIFEKLEDNNIGFPVFVKNTSSFAGKKKNIRVLKDKHFLREYFEVIPSGEYLIQEYIDKEYEVGVQGIAFKSGNVCIPGVIKKIRQSSVATGSTTYGFLSNDCLNVNLKKISALISKIGFSGIFDIELMYKDGHYYLVEINFRNGAYGYAYTVAGYNLPYEWYQNCVSNTEKLNKDIRSVCLVNETADFQNVRCGKISFFRWLIDFCRSDVRLLCNAKDLHPLFFKFFQI